MKLFYKEKQDDNRILHILGIKIKYSKRNIENPLYTQIDDFQQTGYKVEKEYTIGIKHALNFLDSNHPLRIF